MALTYVEAIWILCDRDGLRRREILDWGDVDHGLVSLGPGLCEAEIDSSGVGVAETATHGINQL